MRGDGPLPYPVRHYIAILVSVGVTYMSIVCMLIQRVCVCVCAHVHRGHADTYAQNNGWKLVIQSRNITIDYHWLPVYSKMCPTTLDLLSHVL